MEKRIIVAFSIGRGGRFYNGGHITYIGEKNFQDLIYIRSNDLFERNRDEYGKFCKPYLADASGNVVSDDDYKNSLVGTLNFDNEYDTMTAMYIEDCGDETLEIIAKSYEYKSPELRAYLEAHTGYKFDDLGNIIEEE